MCRNYWYEILKEIGNFCRLFLIDLFDDRVRKLGEIYICILYIIIYKRLVVSKILVILK